MNEAGIHRMAMSNSTSVYAETNVHDSVVCRRCAGHTIAAKRPYLEESSEHE